MRRKEKNEIIKTKTKAPIDINENVNLFCLVRTPI